MVSANELQAAAEAILFAAGEPLELSRLAQALEIEEESAEQVLLNLAASLDERGSGICLLKLGTNISFPREPNLPRRFVMFWKLNETHRFHKRRLKSLR